MKKKLLLSLSLVVAFGIYAVLSQNKSTYVTVPQPNPVPTEPAPTPTPIPNPAPTPTPTPIPKPVVGQYKDGSYTGDITDAFYGNVQVEAIISGGKITDVKFLDYPKDRRTSLEKSTQAMPILTQEAIQAQNANVDIVSGATQTSLAFQTSLASALALAK